MRSFLFLFLFTFSLFSNAQRLSSTTPLFVNSIVSTDIDFIQTTDKDVLLSIQFIGRANKEMPDSRNNMLFDSGTYVFTANFSDFTTIEIWCHSSFGSNAVAKEYADKLAPRLGKLPAFMRNTISHVVVHNGDAGAFAESESNFFVLYSDNMDVRIQNNDLEETVFHESVHASLDAIHLDESGWKNAQFLDRIFITNYAQENSYKEDFAETMLFVYTMVKHPERLSSEIQEWVQTNLPNRFKYIKDNVLPKTLSLDNFIVDANTTLLDIYPNPASKELHIVLKNKLKKEQIAIYNVSGKRVKFLETFKENNKIDLRNLSNGVYYIHVKGYKLAKVVKK